MIQEKGLCPYPQGSHPLPGDSFQCVVAQPSCCGSLCPRLVPTEDPDHRPQDPPGCGSLHSVTGAPVSWACLPR